VEDGKEYVGMNLVVGEVVGVFRTEREGAARTPRTVDKRPL